MLGTCVEALGEAYGAAQKEVRAQAELTDKTLEYDPADIEAIGTQESSGHTICCPSFSCAYADAILDGTVHDHSYYTCSCCTWPDWGGGESSYRCVGTDEEVLREAYDQIAAGRPTVVHVSASTGEMEMISAAAIAISRLSLRCTTTMRASVARKDES